MKVKDIKEIGVIGAGTMGQGIAYVFAKAGFKVYLFDQTKDIAQKAKEKIVKMIEKKICNPIYENVVLDRICPDVFHPFHSVSACNLYELDFVVEAIFEDLDKKQTTFRILDLLCNPDVILATNTSSISISKIAEAVSNARKEKIIGMHFMNPPTKNILTEIIVSRHTDKETIDLTYELAKKINRNPVIVSADVPGFLCNRNLMPSILEALRCVEDEVGSVEDIDKSILLGVGGAMGPLSLGDLIGWDIVLAITKVLQKEFGKRFNPPKILETLVQKKYLGRKTKRGIFDFMDLILVRGGYE